MLATSRVATDERFDASWHDAPFASLVAIPIAGETPGVVLVCFGQEHDFSRDDLELAQQVAGATRGALDRSRLSAERTRAAVAQLARAR